MEKKEEEQICITPSTSSTSPSNGCRRGARTRIPKQIFTPSQGCQKENKISHVIKEKTKAKDATKLVEKTKKYIMEKMDDRCLIAALNNKENITTTQVVRRPLTEKKKNVILTTSFTQTDFSELHNEEKIAKLTAALQASNEEVSRLKAELALLKQNCEASTNADIIKEDLIEVKECVKEVLDLQRHHSTTSNEERENSTMVNVEGIFLDENQYEEAKHCTTISARIRKLTLGYWSPEQQLFVSARKPKGMSESTFRKINWRDYENIRTIVMKLQREQSTRISGLSDEDITFEMIKRYVHAALKKKRYTVRAKTEEEEKEGLQEPDMSDED